MNEKISSILKSVEKPGRYCGGEYGAVIKDRSKVKARFAFAFPDSYEIGMSNLGMRILYGALNAHEDIWCERVFTPWEDMQQQMKANNLPLCALESGDPLGDFDFLGFNSSLEEFARKNQVTQKAIFRAQAVFEELGVQILLPTFSDAFKLSVALEYSQEEETLTMHIKYDGAAFDVRESDNILSLKLAENASQSIEYAMINEDGYTNLVTVKIK